MCQNIKLTFKGSIGKTAIVDGLGATQATGGNWTIASCNNSHIENDEMKTWTWKILHLEKILLKWTLRKCWRSLLEMVFEKFEGKILRQNHVF